MMVCRKLWWQQSCTMDIPVQCRGAKAPWFHSYHTSSPEECSRGYHMGLPETPRQIICQEAEHCVMAPSVHHRNRLGYKLSHLLVLISPVGLDFLRTPPHGTQSSSYGMWQTLLFDLIPLLSQPKLTPNLPMTKWTSECFCCVPRGEWKENLSHAASFQSPSAGVLHGSHQGGTKLTVFWLPDPSFAWLPPPLQAQEYQLLQCYPRNRSPGYLEMLFGFPFLKRFSRWRQRCGKEHKGLWLYSAVIHPD